MDKIENIYINLREFKRSCEPNNDEESNNLYQQSFLIHPNYILCNITMFILKS
jgi:hypothetical protein